MRHLSDANAQDGNFGTQIRSAIFWRSGSQIVSQVVSWTSTLIVVRLLDPADYGLFAMTLVVLNFMGFMNGYRSEEHTSELQSIMRISYAVFCWKQKNKKNKQK